MNSGVRGIEVEGPEANWGITEVVLVKDANCKPWNPRLTRAPGSLLVQWLDEDQALDEEAL
jgi:hypothetical protein